jgi:hypothetical protein
MSICLFGSCQSIRTPPAVVELDEVGEAVAIDISGDERSRAAGGSRGDRGIPSPVTQGVADPVET